MRIARVAYGRAISFAVLEGDEAIELDGQPIGGIRYSGNHAPLTDARMP